MNGTLDQALAAMIERESKKAKEISAQATESIAKTKAAAQAAQEIKVNPAVFENIAKQSTAAKKASADMTAKIAATNAAIANFPGIR